MTRYRVSRTRDVEAFRWFPGQASYPEWFNQAVAEKVVSVAEDRILRQRAGGAVFYGFSGFWVCRDYKGRIFFTSDEAFASEYEEIPE